MTAIAPVSSFRSRVASVRNFLAAGTAVAMTMPGFAWAQSVAATLGGNAETELTAAQTVIVGLLTILVAISIGFLVYKLIKRTS